MGDSGGNNGSMSAHSASVRSEAERGVNILQHTRHRRLPAESFQTVSDSVSFPRSAAMIAATMGVDKSVDKSRLARLCGFAQ
jgi:hypothetical protein